MLPRSENSQNSVLMGNCAFDSLWLNRWLLDLTAIKLHCVVLKILIVVRFESKYSVAQYCKDISTIQK